MRGMLARSFPQAGGPSRHFDGAQPSSRRRFCFRVPTLRSLEHEANILAKTSRVDTPRPAVEAIRAARINQKPLFPAASSGATHRRSDRTGTASR